MYIEAGPERDELTAALHSEGYSPVGCCLIQQLCCGSSLLLPRLYPHSSAALRGLLADALLLHTVFVQSAVLSIWQWVVSQ